MAPSFPGKVLILFWWCYSGETGTYVYVNDHANQPPPIPTHPSRVPVSKSINHPLHQHTSKANARGGEEEAVRGLGGRHLEGRNLHVQRRRLRHCWFWVCCVCGAVGVCVFVFSPNRRSIIPKQKHTTPSNYTRTFPRVERVAVGHHRHPQKVQPAHLFFVLRACGR